MPHLKQALLRFRSAVVRGLDADTPHARRDKGSADGANLPVIPTHHQREQRLQRVCCSEREVRRIDNRFNPINGSDEYPN